jgi:hypothetical protein
MKQLLMPHNKYKKDMTGAISTAQLTRYDLSAYEQRKEDSGCDKEARSIAA